MINSCGVTMKVLTLFPSGSLQETVSAALASRQCVMEIASSVKECAQNARLNEYDAILLDADTKSYGDVLILVRLLRHEQPNVALFVFDRHLDLDQRLQLFDAGVDDCVHEPFFPAEFAVRLGVSIRLRQAASNLDASKRGINVLRSGDLELDLVYRTVTRRGRPIDLRPKEFLLLEYLVRNVNRPVTRTMIVEHVWKSSFEGLTNVVDVYISALRSKLDQGFGQTLIQTNRGVGYTFTSGVPGEAGEQTMSERTYRRPGYFSGH
jgi:two-component system OmpR family response regulator